MMEKTKVLQFIHGFSMGGAETLAKEYCLKLDKEKYDVSVLCFHRYHTPYEKILEEAGVNVVYASDHIKNYDKIAFRYPGRIFMLAKRWSFLKKYLRDSKPDVLHFHMALSIYVLLAKLDKNTKIIRTMHTEPKRRWNRSIGRRIDLWATHKLMKKYPMQFITLHDGMRKEINEMFGVNNSVVLNNGIEFSRFECALDKKTVRRKEGIPENACVIGHVGRFNEVKNHKFLVEVFAKLHEKDDNTFLLLVGNGSTQKQTEEQLKKLGLEKNYKILSQRTDIPDLLNAMDKFVFPSTSEGLGIALIEAQKAGLPCIVSSAVPEAATVSNLVKKLDLGAGAEVWAEEVERFCVDSVVYDGIEEWDMEQIIRSLEKLYVS
ncbi:MAG: glycosyltransferase [Lachnospiraceae bacterium]|nr:glycosyltransferase [Lachnospiraceae bacterium]